MGPSYADLARRSPCCTSYKLEVRAIRMHCRAAFLKSRRVPPRNGAAPSNSRKWIYGVGTKCHQTEVRLFRREFLIRVQAPRLNFISATVMSILIQQVPSGMARQRQAGTQAHWACFRVICGRYRNVTDYIQAWAIFVSACKMIRLLLYLSIFWMADFAAGASTLSLLLLQVWSTLFPPGRSLKALTADWRTLTGVSRSSARSRSG